MSILANFIVTFKLETEKFQEDILDKRFEIARKIYNSLVSVTQKRYKAMLNCDEYKDLVSELSNDSKKNKEVYKKMNALRTKYRLSEYSFHDDVKNMQKHFKKNIDSQVAQKIASNLWKAYDKLFFGNGKEIHYKRFGTVNSVEGKSNKTGIRFVDGFLLWNGLKMKVNINYNNPYEYQAMQSPICYTRIVRKFVRGKNKYYAQIVFKGIAPTKIDKETGEIKHSIGEGDVGIDIGTSTVAISSSNDVKIYELADKVQNIENEKRLILRKMDRSRRSCNPNNYNSDGTIKKQGCKKVHWIESNKYKKDKAKLRELYRRQADMRKFQHECLANYIVSLGNKVYVEKMSFSGLQKRAKTTNKRKKRFGKSIGNRAPAMLMTIVARKLSYYGEQLTEVNTYKCRASQFNHTNETYTKKSLSKRWNVINGEKVQRDMYSAFLIMNVNPDLESFDLNKCNERYDNFKELHDVEVDRLKLKKNLSSIGI